MRKKTAFFFGSGISLKTYPSIKGSKDSNSIASVYGITDALFKEKWHWTARRKIFASGPNPRGAAPDLVTPQVVAFLQKIRQRARRYLVFLRQRPNPYKPHYEDLFSLAEQASRLETEPAPNLAAVDFVRNLRRDTRRLCSSYRGPGAAKDPFRALANAACDFVHWAVDDILRKRSHAREGFDVLADVARAARRVDIFTLNHDTHVEDELKAAGYECDSGFRDRSHGQFLVYQPGWAKTGRRKRVRIFKLHGSLNWYLYRFPVWARQQYAIPLADPFLGLEKRGKRVIAVEGKAAFLSGTIVKEQHYGEGFFSELLEDFRSHLSQHKRLIFCGYGFGDTGINLRIEQWAHDDPKNTLVILTPDKPTAFLVNKPKWLRGLHRKGRIIFVKKYLSQCKLRHVRRYFDDMI